MSADDVENVSQNIVDEKKELMERLSYALAELANMRRIFDAELVRAKAAAVENVARKLITLYEDFERVVKNAENQDIPSELKEALKMLLKELENLLASEGVERMDVLGKEFNPFDHEAVEFQESDDVKSETVVEVVSNGYRYRDKILKPPRVKVAKPKKRSD